VRACVCVRVWACVCVGLGGADPEGGPRPGSLFPPPPPAALSHTPAISLTSGKVAVWLCAPRRPRARRHHRPHDDDPALRVAAGAQQRRARLGHGASPRQGAALVVPIIGVADVRRYVRNSLAAQRSGALPTPVLVPSQRASPGGAPRCGTCSSFPDQSGPGG